MKISTVGEMRALDKRAVSEFGIPEELLMENAGQAAFQVLNRELDVRNKRFVVFCGVGNNGGDGFVVARKLWSAQARVEIFLIGDRHKFAGAAKTNLGIASKLGLPIHDLTAAEEARQALRAADAAIDALFGTGLTREVSGLYAEVIKAINECPIPVFSLDIPSGIHGDNGQIMGTAVQADFTITFGLPKAGNLLYPGYEHGGKLYVSHISFPPDLHCSEELSFETNDPLPLSPRAPDSHKGQHGKVLFIAGSRQYLGAPYFAALSFLRAGGGLSFLATPETVAQAIAGKAHEVIILPQTATNAGSIASENLQPLLAFSETVDLVIIGPGLSLAEPTLELTRAFLKAVKRPVLVDGDGLTAVAADPSCIKSRSQPTALTPHLGEMSRLIDHSVEEIARDRISILVQTARELNSTIVLKGAHSLVGTPSGHIYFNLTGNPGMATAGSGDVLTGAIAAMHGLGLPFEEAVRQGVFLHGLAGDLAARELGEDGVTASDIMLSLAAAVKLLRTIPFSADAEFEAKIQTLDTIL